MGTGVCYVAVFEKPKGNDPTMKIREVFILDERQWQLLRTFRIATCTDESIYQHFLKVGVDALDKSAFSSVVLSTISHVLVV